MRAQDRINGVFNTDAVLHFHQAASLKLVMELREESLKLLPFSMTDANGFAVCGCWLSRIRHNGSPEGPDAEVTEK